MLGPALVLAALLVLAFVALLFGWKHSRLFFDVVLFASVLAILLGWVAGR